MADNFFRVGTANMYDSAMQNLSARQKSLVDLQENLTSGKREVRPSDDPVAAAQAERAMTRIARIQAEQRQLEIQKGNVTQAESTLGDAVGLVQEIRQAVVAAGGGTLTPADRRTYAMQIQSLQDQLKDVINRKDVNGMPLLGSLGSALAPFVGPLPGAPDYLFSGLPGQDASQGTAVASQMDGHAALMFDPQRDGIYGAAVSNANPLYPLNGRQFNTSAVSVDHPEKIAPNTAPGGQPYTYRVVFGATTVNTDGSYSIAYQVTSTNPAFTAVNGTTATLTPDRTADIPINFTDPGGANLSFDVKATPTRDSSGTVVLSPAPGDTVDISATASLMSSIDDAIAGIGSASNSSNANQYVGQALSQIDAGLQRLQNVRSYAGELLNRADRISGDQDNRSLQLEADRSRAEDLDMVKGISDFQNANVGYDAALKSYAQVQRLSLFNYIN